MADIEEALKNINQYSIFGQYSVNEIKTAKKERQENEKKIKMLKKLKDAEEKTFLEEEEKRKKEDAAFALEEYNEQYEEYEKNLSKRGMYNPDNKIYQSERHIRNHIDQGLGGGSIYSNRVQAQIWQGSRPKFTSFDKYSSPSFTFRPVHENSPSPLRSPTSTEHSSPQHEEFPSLSESGSTVDSPSPLSSSPGNPCVAARVRRSRVAANFTGNTTSMATGQRVGNEHRLKQAEAGASKDAGMASTARRPTPSWRDASSAVSINDLTPARRVVQQINNHPSPARDEFQLRLQDFPPIGGGRKH